MVKAGSAAAGRRGALADIAIYAVLTAAGIVTLLPVLHVFSVSFSSPEQVLGSRLMIWPKGWNGASYRFLLQNEALLRSFGITVFITVVGTALNLLFTSTAAYVLSRRELPGVAGFTVFVVVTMVFSAGIIPGYIVVRSLGLIDSVWAMIFPGMISAFNLLLMRNFFWSVPDHLIESAKMDGAGELRILFRLMIPLSLPAMATIGLFYAVGHWNEFFRGIFYLNDSRKWPLQVLLRGIIIQADLNEIGVNNQNLYGGVRYNLLTIQSAAIMAATLPIVLVYPFLQKYFVKGMLLGSVKG